MVQTQYIVTSQFIIPQIIEISIPFLKFIKNYFLKPSPKISPASATTIKAELSHSLAAL